jgi:hypothetical protein
MEYVSQRAAGKAAKKEFGPQWFDHCKLEQLEAGKWVVQLTKPIETPAPVAPAMDAQVEAQKAFFASRFIAPVTEKPEPELSEEEITAAKKQAEEIANAEQASLHDMPNGKIWRKFSVGVVKPTKMVHIIADQMNMDAEAAGKPAPSRKEVQDYCVSIGIASGTARTQYQAWKKANDETKANQRLAAELSDKINHQA